MAYRPSLIRPPVRTSAGDVYRARLERQALVQALIDRLTRLIGDVATEPPQPEFQPQPAPAPRPAGPPQALRVPPSVLPEMPEYEEVPPWLMPEPGPGFIPPSAYDWRRQPGFYESDVPSEWGPS